MYKWEKYHEHDTKNPTFSSSLLNKINKSLKNNHKNDHIEEELSFFREANKKKSSSNKNREDEKMSSLRRACMVEKWMEKKVSDKVMKKSHSKSSNNKTLLEEFDVQDTLYFSTMSTTTTTTSSSSSEFEYSGSAYEHLKQKPRVPACFPPPMPKPVKTRPIEVESKFLEHLEEKSQNQSRHTSKESKCSRSRAINLNIYSNLKNLKQPVSPGVRLTSFINSLFNKDSNNNNNDDNKNKKKNTYNNNKSRTHNNNVSMSEKIQTSSYSTCTTPTTSSYSRSCLSTSTTPKKKKFQEDNGVKRTVRFCPVSVILDEESRPCGHKSLFDDHDDHDRRLISTKLARSLSKRYEELRILNGFEKESDRFEQQKKLEEVALDLLSGYWDTRLSSKNYNTSSKDLEKVNNDGNYGGNHGVKYDQNEDYNDDDDGDGLSCSSSDLFELDHLSLIGNELPVYETTQFDPKRL